MLFIWMGCALKLTKKLLFSVIFIVPAKDTRFSSLCIWHLASFLYLFVKIVWILSSFDLCKRYMYMCLYNLQYPFYINNAKWCFSWRCVCISSVWFISYYTFENCMGRVARNIMATNFMLHKRFCEKSSGILGLFTYYVKILYLWNGLSEWINVYIYT